MQLFATQLQTLPAKVDGHEAVEDLLQQVEKFQTEAHKLLEEEDPEATDIEACVDFGLSLDIELTELAQLKEKQKQVRGRKAQTRGVKLLGDSYGVPLAT